MDKSMDIEFERFDKFVDHVIDLHYYLLFFMLGLVVASWFIRKEIKLKRNEQLNRIFFGAAKKED